MSLFIASQHGPGELYQDLLRAAPIVVSSDENNEFTATDPRGGGVHFLLKATLALPDTTRLHWQPSAAAETTSPAASAQMRHRKYPASLLTETPSTPAVAGHRLMLYAQDAWTLNAQDA